ncbi:unnamed protein product [Rotaria socialis]|uniref:Uncharacterized protein n=1 Tax=Rotaria socialis TaxID=392032 RepID=A0A820U0U9_9BILA|nr:unnamed protein product [Rotaria socialis]CAF4474516.1 unnamed protein product [Rotaria socialis]
MEGDESPILNDIIFNSTAMIFENNEDSLLSIDFNDIDMPIDPGQLFSSFDEYSSKHEVEVEAIKSIDKFFINSNFDIPQTISVPPSNYNDEQKQNIISNNFSSVNLKNNFDISLSFINPPEPIYHVRYVSEITNLPINGNRVNTKNVKKNLSGRYVKGERGRYVTIELPIILSDSSNLFIRVTRLTVPYQDTSFIHPYPLLYSCAKQRRHSDIIIQGSSIYFKINKEEICSRSKHFPNMILTRLKQCQLKHINNLYAFENNDMPCPFVGHNAKNKIARYQLKKSQIDFRLVIKCDKTGEFLNTNIFCRSNSLLEEEGIYSKKSLS